MFRLFALFFVVSVSLILGSYAENEVEIVEKPQMNEIKSTNNCGAQINWFNNVSAYSNGAYQGTSQPCGGCDYSGAICKYQAFEYCARYFQTNGNVPLTAWKFNITYNPDYSPCLAYPSPQVVQVSSDPQPGDLLVVYLGNVGQGPRYHHSAIVKSTNGPNYVNVIEQNMAPSGGNTYNPPFECILRVNTALTKK